MVAYDTEEHSFVVPGLELVKCKHIASAHVYVIKIPVNPHKYIHLHSCLDNLQAHQNKPDSKFKVQLHCS